MLISNIDKNFKSNISGKNKKEKPKEIETLKIVLSEDLPKPKKFKKDISSFGNHKTILGYLNAYFNHCPIKVSPNVIWQLILNNFSKYVNKNSKRLRKKFVDFDGKKNLIGIRIGSFEDVDKYKDGLIEEFCNKISENIGKELTDVLTPNFTTSTKESIISGKVSIMSTFEKYFDYSLFMFSCGIPYIILEGSLTDWEKLLEKLKSLSKYEFYIQDMQKDIEEIINTKKGKINLDFWRKIIMETKEIIKERRPCSILEFDVERKFITGWILDFYNEKKIKSSEVSDLISENVFVKISITEIKTGKTKTGIMTAGILDLKQDDDTFEVEPIINYSFSL